MKDLHELKTWPDYFKAIVLERKTFEVRKNDRDFKEGDILHLREWTPAGNNYTGMSCLAKVTYILVNEKYVKEDFVIMGIKLLE